MRPNPSQLQDWTRLSLNDPQAPGMIGSNHYSEGFNAALEGKELPSKTDDAHRFGYVRGIAERERRQLLRQIR